MIVRKEKLTEFFSIYSFIILLFISLITFPARSDDRDTWQQPERILDSLGIKPDMVIGEVGAGDGYFTFKLAKRLGDSGRIFANDIVESKLQTIKNHCQHEGINNITIVLGEIEDPKFPLDTLEMVIMVYVLHDLETPVPFLKILKSYLKPGASIVIVDRDPAKFGSQDGHFFSREKILQILDQANLEVLKIMTFLPRDNIYICKPR